MSEDRPEMSMSISAGREPGTISIRMYRHSGSTGEVMEKIVGPMQAAQIIGLLGTELARAHQLLRTYPQKLEFSSDLCEKESGT